MSSHRRRFTVRLAGLLVAVVAGLLLAYVVSGFRNGISPVSDSPVNQTAPVLGCESTDTSFCDTEIQFRNLVAAEDISSLLENQMPTPLTCSTQQSVCKGVADGLVIQLFAVQEGHSQQLLTRNSYIGLLRGYFRRAGRFVFVSDVSSGSTVDILFRAQSGITVLRLQFEKNSSGWKFVEPVLES